MELPNEIFVKCFIASLLGNLIHIGYKIVSLQSDYKKAKIEFSLPRYFKDDWIALAFNFFCSMIWVYVIDELVSHSSWVLDKIKLIFIAVGFMGSYAVMYPLSRAKKRFRMIIDEKTSIQTQEEKEHAQQPFKNLPKNDPNAKP